MVFSGIWWPFMALSSGGGGGNRTRVRKSSAVSSTCVAWSIVFNRGSSDWQDDTRRFLKFRVMSQDTSKR